MKTTKITAVIAASLIALSSAAYAAGERGGDRGGKGTENSCAAGNVPIPGANCS